MSNNSGSNWYKCDLHLHTMSSICYLEKSDTPEMWVDRALEQGLDVVAVTDHNNYQGIEGIMEEAGDRGLAVFPGVEITCDSSKIHMLILFDVTKTADTVRDFLNRCDIDSELVGKSSGTSLSVFEVCQIAKKRGALVIASHIDEFNSISSMNLENLNKLLESGLLDAVQVSNTPVWRKFREDKDTDAMNQVLAEKYGPDATPEVIDRWRKCYDRAAEVGLPMLCFSDNQYSPTESKHGLWGIGSVYTWIRMSDNICLESLKQSLITADSRIKMMFDSESAPDTEPDFWIRSLEVRNSVLNPHQPIHIDFHPQMNCIIGGKGSGKSSIVRILMGVYRQIPGILLKNVAEYQTNFYKIGTEDSYGIFTEDSEVEIRYSWYGNEYRLVVNNIKSIDDQKYTFYVIDPETGEEKLQDWQDLKFLSLMSAQVFAERQIHAIAGTPGALLDRVDRSIYDMHILKNKKNYLFEKLLVLSLEYRFTRKLLKDKDRVEAELTWLKSMNENKSFIDYFSSYADSMKELRTDTLKFMKDADKNAKRLKKEYDQCLCDYENSIEEIRSSRRAFIDRVLAFDDNYKIEIIPMGSIHSFNVILKDIFNSDIKLLTEDISTLENALFSKNGDISKYRDLLISIRKPVIEPAGREIFSEYFIHMVNELSDMDFQRLVLFHPEDELKLFYHPTGVKRFFPMTTASTGEKAAAVFSLLLFGGVVPLVMDQPEDSIDNRIIYDEIVPKLKKAKLNRQLIFVTHNANITTNADAERIISMDSWSKFTKVHLQGSMDDPEIRKEICDILEGTETAFLQRVKKYHL